MNSSMVSGKSPLSSSGLATAYDYAIATLTELAI